MTEYTCRFAGTDQPRMLRTHLTDCETDGCPGCQPCPERHCQVGTPVAHGGCGGQAHVTADGQGHDQTCATCLGQTREDGAEIVRLADRTLEEAVLRGVASQAAMLAGPAADPAAWGFRRMSALAGRIDADWLDDCRDEQHPLWVLGTWDMLVRDHLDQPTDERLTIGRAWSYLNGHLTRLAHDPEFAFEELAGDLRRCRLHLEDVLAEGERPDTGAPCMACGALLHRTWGALGAYDGWRCPRCHATSTEDQYRFAVMQTYTERSDRLSIAELAERIEVSTTRLRTWAAPTRTTVDGVLVEQPPRLRSVGKDSSGRKLYPVATAEQLKAEVA